MAIEVKQFSINPCTAIKLLKLAFHFRAFYRFFHLKYYYIRTCFDRRASEEDERLLIDTSNVEASYAFVDAKRKLRLVLSVADSAVPFALHATAGQRHLGTRRLETFLL